ncbi:DEAD-box ATP-dependent RNA helicase 47, mitochondrial [Grifola frondosa]|uniref:RNA helicase n=1 Tax=Grifola frondosa TaxID=5627 RepID=A0A1C7MPQ1_GRIFR|nr:DEAD-box ATP-dependent RNA helicase 47, mitochondrial [Grifola frondosa]
MKPSLQSTSVACTKSRLSCALWARPSRWQIRSIHGAHSENRSLDISFLPSSFPPHAGPTSFEGLGLFRPVIAGLRNAFPSVATPTDTQKRFIPAVLSGNDVMLKDRTGSGKSFGLLLALLSKHLSADKFAGIRPSLVIVPHRDLAYQFLHWIQHMHVHMGHSTSLSSIAQVVIRNADTPLDVEINTLRDSQPQILIGTPQAFWDIVQEDESALPLRALSTVIVDEVDYLIESVPENIENATFPGHLRKHLVTESGWLTRKPGGLLKIGGSIEPKRIQDEVKYTLGGTSVQHCVVVISKNGDITNIEDALEPPASTPETSDEPEIATPSVAPSEQVKVPAPTPVLDSKSPSPFNPNSLEAIAAAFALDVPSVALLVLPSSSPVHRAVYELQMMGINAHGLDVLREEQGRAYLMRRDFNAATSNPTLLVSTLASTRGLDLPVLSHVFIYGVFEDQPVDSYLHIAGRVGRFGRGGKVISVVERVRAFKTDKGKLASKNDMVTLQRVLKKIGVVATKFEHFN